MLSRSESGTDLPRSGHCGTTHLFILFICLFFIFVEDPSTGDNFLFDQEKYTERKDLKNGKKIKEDQRSSLIFNIFLILLYIFNIFNFLFSDLLIRRLEE